MSETVVMMADPGVNNKHCFVSIGWKKFFSEAF